jgi:molybdopterin molybdotransferase
MQKMISCEDAIALIEKHTKRGPAAVTPISQAVGLVLAEDIVADADYPAFNRGMMDGVAARVGDAGKTVVVKGMVAAGQSSSVTVNQGECVEIMTGAPCPAGTEVVVKKEDLVRRGDQITLPGGLKSGRNIADAGCECTKGTIVARAGDVISPLLVANLATFGKKKAMVFDLPSLAIITTGSELAGVDETPRTAQIRDSNGPMLEAMARTAGLREVHMTHADDNHEAIAQALERVGDVDIVAFTGGVSEGNYDLVPGALERYGATTVFHKVDQKPGRPLLFATKKERLFFGLPGTPLGSHLGMYRYLMFAAQRFAGRSPNRPQLRGSLVNELRLVNSRWFFLLGRAVWDSTGWQITTLRGEGASDIFAPALANCYISLPKGEFNFESGASVDFELLPCLGGPG